MEGQDTETLLQLVRQLQEDGERKSQLLAEDNRKLEYLDQLTTLSEYLDACHVKLYLGLTPGEPAQSTGGPAARPEGKPRPNHTREWLDFPDKQKEIWADLMDIDFGSKRLFSPLGYLNRKGPEIRKHVRSELDLHDFDTGTVRLPLISIIENLFADPHLRQVFDLHGTIDMENHANTLVDEDEDGSPPPPAKLRKTSGVDATPTTPTKSSRPLADESAEIMAQRFMAAIITQPFSYMIQGREVGETTGFSAAEPDADNRLHLTAVGQVLAFTLQALRTPPRPQSSRKLIEKKLKIWDLDYSDPVDIPVPEIPSTPGFLQTRQRTRSYIRSSPVVTREQRKIKEQKKQKGNLVFNSATLGLYFEHRSSFSEGTTYPVDSLVPFALRLDDMSYGEYELLKKRDTVKNVKTQMVEDSILG